MTPEELEGRLDLAMQMLVDEHVGVVRFVEEVKREPGGPEFFHFAAKASNTGAFCRQVNFADTGGAATERARAAAKALGEAVERYCSAIYEIEELPLFAFDSAPGDAVDPSDFALYSSVQYESDGFPWVPFRHDTPVRWVEAENLSTGRSIYVPAARVFMPYSYYVGTNDAPIDQPISTGLACHTSQARARVAAICEVIERDAVAICWQAKMSMPVVRVETLDDHSYDLVQRLERSGARVTIVNITLDHGIPTLLAILRAGSGRGPALVVAAASAPLREQAVSKALEELAHSRRYCQYVRTHLPPLRAEPPHYAEVKDQLTHLGFYVAEENTGHAAFLWQSEERVEFESIANLDSGDDETNVRALAERVAAVGEQLLLRELTTADVASAGLHVVRAVVPGCHPIHMGHGVRSLGGIRLWTVPQKLGYAGITPDGGDNPAPHPYP